MNKTFAVFLIFTGLVTFVHAVDIPVNVGGPAGENIFEPAMIVAAPGDNIIFTWASGKHSILQSDTAKSCAKSVSATAFINSGGVFMAPKTWTVIIPKVVGKTLFYCGVPGHCVPGTGGMEGTLVVTDDGKSPAAGGAAPKGAEPTAGATSSAAGAIPSSSTVATQTSYSAPSASKSPNNNSLIGAIIGSLIGGSVLTIGIFILYSKKFKNKKIDNPRQIPGSEFQIHNDQAIPAASIGNRVVNNHGREAPISGNNDLQNYVVQIVRQEMQDQRNNMVQIVRQEMQNQRNNQQFYYHH